MGIGFGITFGIVSLGIAWRARRRGRLLLDAGALEEPLLSRNPIAYVPVAIALAGAWLWSRSGGPYPLVAVAVAFAGVLAVAVVMKKRIRLRFTDQGICFVRLIRWGEIHSYRWDKNPEGGEELVLHLSGKGRNSIISYPIPVMHREHVAEILAAHVASGAAGAAP